MNDKPETELADMPMEYLGKRRLIPVRDMPPMSKDEQIEFVKKIIQEHYDVLKALGDR